MTYPIVYKVKKNYIVEKLKYERFCHIKCKCGGFSPFLKKKEV